MRPSPHFQNRAAESAFSTADVTRLARKLFAVALSLGTVLSAAPSSASVFLERRKSVSVDSIKPTYLIEPVRVSDSLCEVVSGEGAPLLRPLTAERVAQGILLPETAAAFIATISRSMQRGGTLTTAPFDALCNGLRSRGYSIEVQELSRDLLSDVVQFSFRWKRLRKAGEFTVMGTTQYGSYELSFVYLPDLRCPNEIAAVSSLPAEAVPMPTVPDDDGKLHPEDINPLPQPVFLAAVRDLSNKLVVPPALAEQVVAEINDALVNGGSIGEEVIRPLVNYHRRRIQANGAKATAQGRITLDKNGGSVVLILIIGYGKRVFFLKSSVLYDAASAEHLCRIKLGTRELPGPKERE